MASWNWGAFLHCLGAQASRPHSDATHYGSEGIAPLTAPWEQDLSKVDFLGKNGQFSAFPCTFCPLSLRLLLPRGERGSVGVLMPETEDDTQELPQKLAPVEESGTLSLWATSADGE